ncbi:MAG: zinc ribbon domain-containing protein [Proteobacteria bacterium]|nr:zinc ribbon domain-containing protein [Pseudomonadota bacterium]MBU1739801.1 zinc ribbon domain-containing protein [Pseudomonadota bacterium]
MPIFEFECRDCRHKFEEITKVRETVCCPQCKSGNLKKLLSASVSDSNNRKCNWGEPGLPNKQEFERIRRSRD